MEDKEWILTETLTSLSLLIKKLKTERKQFYELGSFNVHDVYGDRIKQFEFIDKSNEKPFVIRSKDGTRSKSYINHSDRERTYSDIFISDKLSELLSVVIDFADKLENDNYSICDNYFLKLREEIVKEFAANYILPYIESELIEFDKVLDKIKYVDSENSGLNVLKDLYLSILKYGSGKKGLEKIDDIIYDYEYMIHDPKNFNGNKNAFSRIICRQIDKKILMVIFNELDYSAFEAYNRMTTDFHNLLREDKLTELVEKYSNLDFINTITHSEYISKKLVDIVIKNYKEYLNRNISSIIMEFFKDDALVLNKMDKLSVAIEYLEFLLKYLQNKVNRSIMTVDISDFSKFKSNKQVLINNKLVELSESGIKRLINDYSLHFIEKLWCTGDGFHAVFKYPEEAIRLATSLAIDLDKHNSDNPTNEIHYRIGLHYGELHLHYDVSKSWNYIGEAINDTNRIISVIENLDDTIFVSSYFRNQLMNSSASMRSFEINRRKFPFYLTAKGRHKDKHGKSHRIYVFEHQKFRETMYEPEDLR